MTTLLGRAFTRITAAAASMEVAHRQSRADQFLGTDYPSLVDSPNGRFWFQSMPLPDGSRVRGASADPGREPNLWAACFGRSRDCLSGKTVLDVGANDGYFSLAALLCGASEVAAVNTLELTHGTFPANLQYAARKWQLAPRLIAADFHTLPTERKYDVIFFFGVLNHLESVHAGVRHLERLLAPNGRIYLETPISGATADVPVMEVASDVFGRVPQYRAGLNTVGNSNYLVPNELAVRAIAETHGLMVDPLPLAGLYEGSWGVGHTRRVFVLSRMSEGALPKRG